jgi:hypothetical protein
VVHEKIAVNHRAPFLLDGGIGGDRTAAVGQGEDARLEGGIIKYSKKIIF